MQVAETRRLVAHEKLLIDVIKRQAGTLKKAILEGTMNSIEAGATKIDIKFVAERSQDRANPNPAFLSIYDDGIGIKTKEELEKHFETFGQPHESTENVIWKQFRMGRGQMFAFGKNTWRTSTFQMVVDIDKTELDWSLMENLESVDGCKIDIELYKNPLDDGIFNSIKSFKEEVKEQVRFVKIPVYFNDELISVNPITLNWDYEDDDAYYKFTDTSNLMFYNLGVYVMSKTIKEAGVGGIIVSKKQLIVNFARNDIQSTCLVYKNINKVIQTNKIKKMNKQSASMSADNRMNVLCDLRDAALDYYEVIGKRIFRTAQNKWLSWNMIMKDGRPWCFAPLGDRIADKGMEMGVALCFDDKVIDELGYSGPLNEFFDWLWSDFIERESVYKHHYFSDCIKRELDILRNNFLMYDNTDSITDGMDYRKLKDMFNEEYKIVPYEKLTKSEKRVLDHLNHLHCWEDRKIKIGISTVAQAWTDGATYITFDRKWLNEGNLHSESFLLKLFTVGCHELAHDVETTGTHHHGEEFYEKYYEITMKNYYNNPLSYISKFADIMKNAKIDEKIAQEREKEQSLKDKLGLVG
jgi:hypothetical protein